MEENNPDIAIEEVRKYLQGKMTAEEVSQFENRIANDPSFAEEVQLNRELLESMNHHFRSKLKERLSHEDNKAIPLNDKPRKPNFRRVWVMAASVALIAVASYFLFSDDPDHEQLYNQYHITYYNVVQGSTRSGESDAAVQAFQYYDQGNFKEAADGFAALVLEEEKNFDWLFYQGLSNLEIQESEAAIDAFEKVLEASTNEWIEPAQWYLGLAYLQADNTKEAKLTFGRIVSGGKSYSDRAAELLGKL
ncbi:MAG: tetratricopeptide repeat protein [Cyclobacteriaceae bacterium]